MGWPFKKRNKQLSREDIRFLHLLCLGREPAHESEYCKFDGQSLFAALKTILSGREFRCGVMEPLLLGLSPAYTPFSKSQQQFLTKAANKHYKASAASTHTYALANACHWPRFVRAVEASRFPFPVAEFATRLEQEQHKKPRQIIGGLEELTSSHCSGYAFCPDTPETSFRLDFYINGTFLGSSVADGTRGDIAEAHGNSGKCGFRHTINLPPHLSRLENLTLSVFDHESGALACPPRVFPNVGITYLPYLLQLSHSLETACEKADHVSDAVTAIQAQLPTIKQYSAMPLSNYGHYAEIFAPPILEAGPEQPTPLCYSNESHLKPRDGAAAWFDKAAKEAPNAVLFFCDHESLKPDGLKTRLQPVCKAGFDYDQLLTRGDYAAAFAIRPEALEKTGGTLENPHDLWLRVYETYGESGFHHIPQILYRATGVQEESVQGSEALSGAVEAHFQRQKIKAYMQPCGMDHYAGEIKNALTIEWPIDESKPKLAIIIPMKDALDLTRNCINSLQSTLMYPEATQIIIVDNGSQEAATKSWLIELENSEGIRVLHFDAPFNWAELNNWAVDQCDAEYLLFLNNDTVALDKGWDHTLRGYLHRDEIGCVGARLLFEDGTIQHAGVILNEVSLATHEGHGQTPDEGGYMDRTKLPHRCAAVTGAFLACTRDTFEKAGRFDADNFAVAFNDIDFCLKLVTGGATVLYVPALTFLHLESKSRGYDALDPAKEKRAKAEHLRMKEKWQNIIQQDPYYAQIFLAQGFAFSYLAVPQQKVI